MQLKCHNYYRYFLCELSQESGHIGKMDQTEWKRWNSEVNDLIIIIMIIINLFHHAQMGCMPLQTNTSDCGVFICMVS